CQNSNQRQARPLPEAETSEELFARVLQGGLDRIDGGEGQGITSNQRRKGIALRLAASMRNGRGHPSLHGNYSKRSASTGSRFAAREAGIRALRTPTNSNTSVDIITVKNEILRWMSAFPDSSSNSGPSSGRVPTPTATT